MRIKKSLSIALIAILSIAFVFPFNTAFADETIYYQVATSTSTNDLAMGDHPTEDYTFAGIEITASSSIVGLDFNRIQAYLSHATAGNPTGIIRAGVWSSSTIPTASNVQCLIGTIQAEQVDAVSGQNFWNFTKPSGTCELTSGSVVGIYYDPAGTNTNNIKLADRANAFDGTNTYQSLYSEVSDSWIDETGTDAVLRIILVDVEAQQDTAVCIDINGDGDTDVCYDDSNGDGIPDSGGALETVTNQNPPHRAVGRLLCQTGVIVDCAGGEPNDDDVQTNGTGLVLFFALLAVMMAVIGSALYGRIKIEYNIMLQIPVLIIATGLAVAFGWIETMWLYIMIFIIIGFASLAGTKFIMGHTRGRGASD